MKTFCKRLALGIVGDMPSEKDKEKAKQLKKEVEELRAHRNNPATPKSERARLKLQIETRIWVGERLDPELFKNYKGSAS